MLYVCYVGVKRLSNFRMRIGRVERRASRIQMVALRKEKTRQKGARSRCERWEKVDRVGSARTPIWASQRGLRRQRQASWARKAWRRRRIQECLRMLTAKHPSAKPAARLHQFLKLRTKTWQRRQGKILGYPDRAQETRSKQLWRQKQALEAFRGKMTPSLKNKRKKARTRTWAIQNANLNKTNEQINKIIYRSTIKIRLCNYPSKLRMNHSQWNLPKSRREKEVDHASQSRTKRSIWLSQIGNDQNFKTAVESQWHLAQEHKIPKSRILWDLI